MALKILVTGDIHIGKKSSSVKQDTDESATKSTWAKIVDYAIMNDVAVLALTGDVVDQDNRYFEAIGPLQTGFEKLKKAGIDVFMVSGNHDFDVLSQLVDSNSYENVHLLGKNGTWEMKTFAKNGEYIQFVGWSFPKRHFNEDPLMTFNIEGIDSSLTTIGLLHGDVDVPDSNYAPIDLNNFSNLPVNAWMLGHIHKPQILRAAEPLVYYPGSPHALSSKETGIHGPVLLTIHSTTSIEKIQIPLSPVRYETIAIDITDQITEADVRNKLTSTLYDDAKSRIMELEKVSFLIYDIHLVGQHSKIKELETWVKPIIDAYDQEIDATETRISVRKVVMNVRPKVDNLKELALESSPAGILANTIIALNNGETTDFSEKLLLQWKSIHSNIKQAPVYQPLNTSESFDLEENHNAEKYILNECNRILTELIEQQNQ
ncbi:DNA repair exonuclease [Brumimicrobium glaciale]|uniref:DNA repair exonuclease n=1 Tax=Brumimicrobium glaciale TaxID=200475 RepID=A0A4Q4KQW4_9FLAO|nr:DNA repair exonuclease [Brumimicrobium glaciale]RYM34964.1 DNA repair exonuclease [Brumimicrobium glaciale]